MKSVNNIEKSYNNTDINTNKLTERRNNVASIDSLLIHPNIETISEIFHDLDSLGQIHNDELNKHYNSYFD